MAVLYISAFMVAFLTLIYGEIRLLHQWGH